MKVTIEGQSYEVEARRGEIVVDGKPVAVQARRQGQLATVEIGGKSRQVEIKGDTVVVDGKPYAVALESTPQRAPAVAPVAPAAPKAAVARPVPEAAAPQARPAPAAAPSAGPTSGTMMRAPMPGKILRVLDKEGDEVAFGGPLMVLEAMKMENEIKATAAGKVTSLPVVAGSTVNAGDVLAVIS